MKSISKDLKLIVMGVMSYYYILYIFVSLSNLTHESRRLIMINIYFDLHLDIL